MVEIKLDVLDEDMMQNDECFVSVRVGDNQKLSRLAPSRTYRFPKAADRHYGKIEVFKRIGSTAISIDPLNDMRNVVIPLSDDTSMGFKVDIEADDKVKAQRRKQQDMDKASTKADAAKEYLSYHSLEVRLSEAMHALLREKPVNPAEFLSQQLLNSQHIGGVPIPSPKKAMENHDIVLKSAPPPAVRTLSPTKGPYQLVDQSSMESIYGKFQVYNNALERTADQKTSSAAVAAYLTKPSVGTWHMTIPKSMKLKIEAAAKKDASTVAKPTPTLKNATYAMAPSVGTWLAKPQPVKIKTEETQSWKFRPSVGSWLMAPPAEEPEEPKPNRMMLQRGLLFGPSFHGRGLMLI